MVIQENIKDIEREIVSLFMALSLYPVSVQVTC